jgi:hypothetical protein
MISLESEKEKERDTLKREWVFVQAHLFPHYFLCTEGIGIMTTVRSLLRYGVKPRLFCAVARIWGIPRLTSAITRI